MTNICPNNCHPIDDPDSDYHGCSCEGGCLICHGIKPTKPEHPVVEVLELASDVDHQCSIQDAAWLRKKTKEALPIARELVEYKEGLEWLAENDFFMLENFRHMIAGLEKCPAIIKRLIGEKHD